jgi:hypothetical protein
MPFCYVTYFSILTSVCRVSFWCGSFCWMPFYLMSFCRLLFRWLSFDLGLVCRVSFWWVLFYLTSFLILSFCWMPVYLTSFCWYRQFAECHIAECHSAMCFSANCRGARWPASKLWVWGSSWTRHQHRNLCRLQTKECFEGTNLTHSNIAGFLNQV